MAISYNLTFLKFHPSSRQLLDKEGEIVLKEKGFQLRGKGAGDLGESIHFGDIREIILRDDGLEFSIFLQYRYVLKNFGNLFEQFLRDFYRSRNEFLVEALFFRQGKLLKQYDAMAENEDGGGVRAKIRLYEESLVIMPENSDAHCFPFCFLKNYEFDDDEFHLKIENEHGGSAILSQFGNEFEDFQEQLNQALATMYSGIVKQFQNFFFSFKTDVLVKLSNVMKHGNAVRLKTLEKIDKDLLRTIHNAIFKDEIFAKTLEPVKKLTDDDSLFLGIHLVDPKKEHYFFTAICAVPEKNLLTCTLGSYDGEIRKVQDTYFFRISSEGHVQDDISVRVLELNQALTLLHFIPDPFYKDKRELQKSLYRLAIRKLPFLRNLRRNFLGRCPSILPEIFLRNFQKFEAMAKEAAPKES